MVKKGVFPVVQRMNQRVLTTREASRFAQNERRKAQRRLARILSEETGEKINWKNSYERSLELTDLSSQAESLKGTIEALTSKPVGTTKQRKGYQTQIETEAESIQTFTYFRFGQETLSKKGEGFDVFRRNEMFTHEINQSTKKEGLSSLNKNVTHGFYAATQWIWEGASSSDNRNLLIMREFGISDLEQVYKLITNKTLKPEDFGFDSNDEELFEQWLDEIRERIDIDELREIFKEEIGGKKDIKQSGDYAKDAIKNIRIRTASFERRDSNG